jgi:hypothetical protein
LDTRWLPWIGAWQLVSNTIQESESATKQDYSIEISPAGDGNAIVMKSYRAGEFQLEKTILADETRRAIQDTDCSGWYKYFWSDTGRRLLFESVSICPGEEPRLISGMSMITKDQVWMDVQRLKYGNDIAISVRKYESTGKRPLNDGRVVSDESGRARFPVGFGFSIEEIIELSHKVAPEVIAVALVELRQTFPINSETLARLADENVPSDVVDLMVALSFPQKFTIEQDKIAPVPNPGPGDSEYSGEPPFIWLPFGYWSIYGPYSPWYWYPAYGYWGSGWVIWSGGGYSKDHHDRDGHGGGRLVNGRGYSRVAPTHGNSGRRYAQPRTSSENPGSNGQAQPTSSAAPDTSGSKASAPADSSAGSGSGSTHSSSSASPGGYHSGVRGDSQAHPKD